MLKCLLKILKFKNIKGIQSVFWHKALVKYCPIDIHVEFNFLNVVVLGNRSPGYKDGGMCGYTDLGTLSVMYVKYMYVPRGEVGSKAGVGGYC